MGVDKLEGLLYRIESVLLEIKAMRSFISRLYEEEDNLGLIKKRLEEVEGYIKEIKDMEEETK